MAAITTIAVTAAIGSGTAITVTAAIIVRTALLITAALRRRPLTATTQKLKILGNNADTTAALTRLLILPGILLQASLDKHGTPLRKILSSNLPRTTPASNIKERRLLAALPIPLTIRDTVNGQPQLRERSTPGSRANLRIRRKVADNHDLIQISHSDIINWNELNENTPGKRSRGTLTGTILPVLPPLDKQKRRPLAFSSCRLLFFPCDSTINVIFNRTGELSFGRNADAPDGR